MTVKFSPYFKDVARRIKKLPKIYPTYIKAYLLKDVQGILIQWHNGILKNSLGLEPLKATTIAAKARKGQSSTPLLGKGEDVVDSYINMWQVRETKTGFTLRIKDSAHYSGLPLRALFRIHEFGATIAATSKSGNPIIIKIPARPAMTKAYQKWLMGRAKDDRPIKKAVTQYLNTGKSRMIDAVTKLNASEKHAAWYG